MIVYSDEYLKHDLEGHPENKERLKSVLKFLRAKGVFDLVPLAAPDRAGEEDILRVHSKAHLDHMKAIAKTGTRVLGDTYFTRETYETALLSAGGVLKCITGGRKPSFALVRPPGHHATRDEAMGFCIFNNVAVGAASARHLGHKKIAILDFDLHHGNGTQEIFFNEDILYISLHQWPHYPGTGAVDELGEGKGEGYTINIPLPAGAADKSYRRALEEIVFPVIQDFSPDILLASAGYDGHFNDPLGGLCLSSNLYFRIAKEAKALVKKVVFSLEGGYNLNALSHCVYASMQGLFDLDGDVFDAEQTEDERVTRHVENQVDTIKETVSDYWNV